MSARTRAVALGRWYASLPFSHKLGLFPALTGAALAVVLLVTGGIGLSAERQLARIERTHYPSVEVMWELEQDLRAIERTLQDAATTGDAERLSEADSLAAAFLTTLARQPNGAADTAHAAIGRLFREYYPVARGVSARLLAGASGDSITTALASLAVRHGALGAALAADAVADREAIGDAFQDVREGLRRAWLACVGLALAAIATLAALSRLATTSLSRPLRQAVGLANRVATGDLDVDLPTADDSEIGQLLQSMGRMVRNLRDGERRLVHQATHDALTGLPNRVLFRERVARATATPDAAASAAVLYVDLDHFKDVNDGLGHHVGDLVLVEVAERLLRATRGSDTVARLGGDEFAVLLSDVGDSAEASVVADRICQALRAPVRTPNTDVSIGASVGIALGADTTAADLVRRADMAMYAVKHERRGGHRVYEAAMQTAIAERLALESDLRGALERGEFFLQYQPVVDLATGCVVGAEALARWRHPTRGLVPPTTFIPVAESTGLIVALGAWVLHEACRQAAEWYPAAPRALEHAESPFRVSVNLSVWQIRDPALLDEVHRALAAAELPATALTLEITESVMLRQTEATLARLHALKALGVCLAIDDFGTGYSSLSYLQRLPVDVLKIDKSFVDDLATDTPDASDAPITRAIVALGGALGLRVVAEGVEREAQAEALRRLGCALGQGYHFGRPMGPQELTARVREACSVVA